MVNTHVDYTDLTAISMSSLSRYAASSCGSVVSNCGMTKFQFISFTSDFETFGQKTQFDPMLIKAARNVLK